MLSPAIWANQVLCLPRRPEASYKPRRCCKPVADSSGRLLSAQARQAPRAVLSAAKAVWVAVAGYGLPALALSGGVPAHGAAYFRTCAATTSM